MALFLDLDNDGDDDLVVLNDSSPYTTRFPPGQIYRNNGDGTFTNVSVGSGFAPVDPTIGGATAGDYDHDGDLDLFVVGWFGYATYLYRNEGDFRFTDVTDAAGARPASELFQWTPLFVDVDGDGWQDLFCAVDFAPDYLLRNNRDGTFTDVTAEAGTTHVGNDMGVAVGDVDGDGDLDLFTTNISGGEECGVPYGCNMLYVNDGAGRFTDGTAAAGVGDTAWGWGVWLFDADLDGDRDLLAVSGWTQPEWHTPATLLLNGGTGRFRDATTGSGLERPGNTRSLVPIDLENDGDVDFIVTDVLGPAIVYENRSERGGAGGAGGGDGRWLTVEAEGTSSNRNGVGARVWVTAGGRRQVHEITAGGSFYAGPPLEAHFGLGSVRTVDEITVRFPSGHVVRQCGAGVDRRIRIVEPAGAPCPGDVDGGGSVGLTDLVALLSAWGPCGGAGCCPGDVDLSGHVGLPDLLAVLSAWGACP